MELDYDTAYRFASRDFEIPEANLSNDGIFETIDMTYYYNKCKGVLKNIYDKSFKKHQIYRDLESKLQKNDLRKNLTK